jgi:hypothetical protein
VEQMTKEHIHELVERLKNFLDYFLDFNFNFNKLKGRRVDKTLQQLETSNYLPPEPTSRIDNC